MHKNIQRLLRALRLLPLLLVLGACAPADSGGSLSGLPPEAIVTQQLIQAMGPLR